MKFRILVFLMLLSNLATAQVYKCEVNGVSTFSQQPCSEDAELTNYKNQPLVRIEPKPFVPTAYEISFDSALADKAKLVIKGMLKDPESAIFSDLITTLAPDNKGFIGICGQVNAKNSYGGYTGNKPFAVINGRAYLWDDDLYFNGIDLNGSLKRQCILKPE